MMGRKFIDVPMLAIYAALVAVNTFGFWLLGWLWVPLICLAVFVAGLLSPRLRRWWG